MCGDILMMKGLYDRTMNVRYKGIVCIGTLQGREG